jgi:tellurite resistance protein TerC
MYRAKDEDFDPESNILVRLAKRFFPVSATYDGEKFFTKIDGKRAITPLFLVLLVVESTDVLFAVDSIPAVFAITTDRFLVYTSNIFAILNLRSLYFALGGLLRRFRFLKESLTVVLAYVGIKMILKAFHGLDVPPLIKHGEINPIASLCIIVLALAIGVFASIIADRRLTARSAPPRAGREATEPK